MNNDIKAVSIKIGQKMYETFSALPNTFAHALADFVDNAVQSYVDSKDNLLKIDAKYRLRIDVDIEWDEITQTAKKIIIRDNAAGMDEPHFLKAFIPAERPEEDEGLHEFGMGMKTAALWLGDVYSVRTKSYLERVERTVLFNQQEVVAEELLEIPVQQKEVNDLSHYTVIEITNLRPNNAPKRRTISSCMEELGSIYRQFLRREEIDIYVCGIKVEYEDQPILETPYYKDPKGKSIVWKQTGEVSILQYKARYTVGLLRTMSSKYNEIVLLRRGRVIIGAGEHKQYYNKDLCGQEGSPQDRRFFAEIELEGFKVSFNKNNINDQENLDALLRVIASELHNQPMDILRQGKEYREDKIIKAAKQLVKQHTQSKKQTITYIPDEVTARVDEKINVIQQPNMAFSPVEKVDGYEENYEICGESYRLEVQLVKGAEWPDAFWTDISRISEHIIICKINMEHTFFQHFGQPKGDVIAILKAITMAKFTAQKEGKEQIDDLPEYINNYLQKIKV